MCLADVATTNLQNITQSSLAKNKYMNSSAMQGTDFSVWTQTFQFEPSLNPVWTQLPVKTKHSKKIKIKEYRIDKIQNNMRYGELGKCNSFSREKHN